MKKNDMSEYSRVLADNIHRNTQHRLSNLPSAKRGKITEQILSATVDAYVKTNPGCNNLTGSADKQSAHLKEEHPELVVGKPPVPRLDLHLEGGKRNLSLESEFEGPKAVDKDFEKLQSRPIDEDKVIFTETKSKKEHGKYTSKFKAASASDGGTYTHVDIFRRKNA